MTTEAIPTGARSSAVATDEPQYSSAALCICFHHYYFLKDDKNNDHNFLYHPEYTHQYFENEYIPGYQPFDEVIRAAWEKFTKHDNDLSKRPTPTTVLHRSHFHHCDHPGRQLNIHVYLAPSGLSCLVQFETANDEIITSDLSSKRPRLSSHDNVTNNNNDDPAIGDDQKNNDNIKISYTDIVKCLSKFLPNISTSANKQQVTKNYLREPIGNIGASYTTTEGTKFFCICVGKGTDSNVAKYHSTIQSLALGWIETAENVDISCTDNGYWNVIYLFQRHDESSYSLVGYITLFHFYNPFYQKNKGGTIVRICQALILPPFQRQGHGKQLLQFCYQNYINNDDHHTDNEKTIKNNENFQNNIVQINVEDPAPAFTTLRAIVEYQYIMMTTMTSKLPDWYTHPTEVPTALSLNENQIQEISSTTKITNRQIVIVYEIHIFKTFLWKQGTDRQDDSKTKPIRLMIKKRLNKEHSEELSEITTKAGKQSRLAKLYEEQIVWYEKILSSLEITIL